MAEHKSIDDLDVGGKMVLVRADLNVPMAEGGVADTTRIDSVVPTVKTLLNKGAKVAVLSHLGRPKGQVVPEMSLKPVAAALEEAIGADVIFASDCIGDAAQEAIADIGPGQVVLLENLRFHAGEEKNDPEFAKALAELGDAYVNDAFSAAHRAHASTEGIAHLLPSAAGVAMLADIEALEKALEAPERPVAAIVGGAKVSTKLDVLGHITGRIDHLIIGGAMANTFLYAGGVDVGNSLCEDDLADTAREIRQKAEAGGCRIHLPEDVIVAQELKEGAQNAAIAVDSVRPDDMILDIGSRTVAALGNLLAECHTLLWNGPLGAFEVKPFDAGTTAVAERAAELTESGGLLSVAGGGDTVAALRNAGVLDRMSHVSTAGGAFLEWLEGKSLPGVKILEKAG